MSKKFHCRCGTTINGADDAMSVRCPECESTVVDAQQEAPIQQPPAAPVAAKRRKSKLNPSTIESPPAGSTFEPLDSPPKVLGKRRVRRLRQPPEGGSMEADINPFPKWLRSWLDPALLLWMPILAPALAFTFGVIAFGIGLLRFGILGLPGTLFGSWLALMPTALVVFQWSEILRDWAGGADRDPEWPTFDAFEMLRRLVQWAASAAVAVLVGYGIYRGLVWGSNELPGFETLPIGGSSVIAAAVYFPIAVLAVVLWDSLIVANPLVVLPALFRLRKGAAAFWGEYAAHVAMHMGVLHLAARVRSGSLATGLLVWLVWWCVVLISVSRLMRILGQFYHRNAKQVGWFK